MFEFFKSIASFLKKIYKILILAAAVIIFFAGYNTFLVDHSLDDLRFSLEGVSSADTVIGTQNFGLLMDYNIIREISAKKINSIDLATIEFSRRVLTQGEWSRKVEDIKFALEQVVNGKIKQRGEILVYTDKLVQILARFTSKIFYLPANLLRSKPKPGIAADTSILEEARRLEESWRLMEALALYQRFLKGNPLYENKLSVLLRIGYLYQKLSKPGDAEKTYRRVVSEGYGTFEAQVAKRLLIRLGQTRKLLAKKKSIITQINQGAIPAEGLQDAYIELAGIDMELFDFDGAQRALQKTRELDPESERGLHAKFMLAWLDKYRGDLEKAARSFEEIVKLPGEEELILSGNLELADLYRKKGELRKSAEKLEDIADRFVVKPVAPLAQYEAGSTYLYDVKDTEAAFVAFEKLKEKFPTSVYTVEGLKRLEEFREASGRLLDDYQPIILSWIEKTIPESSAVFIHKVRSAVESLIEEQGKGDFELSYTDQELMDLVNSKFIEAVPYQVYNLNMAIKKDGIEVTGDLKLRLLAFGGRCSVKPVIKAGRINMEIISAEVAGMEIPDVLMQELMGSANRAFGTENFPIDIRNIKLEDGILKVEGTI